MMNEFREVSYTSRQFLTPKRNKTEHAVHSYAAGKGSIESNADAANAKPLAVNYKAQNSKHLVDNKRNGKKVGTEGKKICLLPVPRAAAAYDRQLKNIQLRAILHSATSLQIDRFLHTHLSTECMTCTAIYQPLRELRAVGKKFAVSRLPCKPRTGSYGLILIRNMKIRGLVEKKY